jgi:hypothetical protein
MTGECTAVFASKKSPARRIFQSLKNVALGCLVVGSVVFTSPVWITLTLYSALQETWRNIRFRWWLHTLGVRGFLVVSEHPAWDAWVQGMAKTHGLKVLYRENAYYWSKREHELVQSQVPQADRPQANWWRARRAFPVIITSSKFSGWLRVWNGSRAWKRVFRGDGRVLADEELVLAKQLR